MALTPEEVATYLQQNPVFFEDYAALLAHMHVPNPHGGRAIALSDRQVSSLRDKNKALEAKLAELIQFGEENDVISEKVHRLALALLAARALPILLHQTYFNLREDFRVPHVSLRVWRGTGEVDEFNPVSEELRRFAGELEQPFCGTASSFEAVSWFGEAAPHVRSVAFIPLRELDDNFGLLALGSEDLLRFYPEMGTLYLKRIGELVGAGLLRFV